MNKELAKEEVEEFYNKLWLENKKLIQENIDKTNTERFELELELVDKDKEIERLNNIINELEKWLEEDLKQVYRDAGYRHNLIFEVLEKLQELKGSDKE